MDGQFSAGYLLTKVSNAIFGEGFGRIYKGTVGKAVNTIGPYCLVPSFTNGLRDRRLELKRVLE